LTRGTLQEEKYSSGTQGLSLTSFQGTWVGRDKAILDNDGIKLFKKITSPVQNHQTKGGSPNTDWRKSLLVHRKKKKILADY